MFGNKLVFLWCCALLLVASSSKHQRNLMNYNEKHDISTAQYKTDENSIESDEKDIVNKTDCNEDSNECYVPHEICVDGTCILACCHLDDHLTECIPGKIIILHAFVDGQYSLKSKNQEINLTAYGFLYDPCRKIKQFHILTYEDIDNVLIANGTVYFPYHAEFVESKSFCLMDKNNNMLRTGCDITIFNINFPTEIVSRILIYKSDSPDNPNSPDNPLETILNNYISIYVSLRIISILFLLTIFLVYSILPQLNDKHGFILRNCIGATIVSNIDVGTIYLATHLGYYIELTFVSIWYFGTLATCFWSTVMSFDIWWSFSDIFSLQANMRNPQQKKKIKKKEGKKLFIYSVYAWGISFFLTVMSVFMNSFVMLPLDFGFIIFSFIENPGAGLYNWIPTTICSISSICLLISTALKIRRYEKDTTHHVINVDNRVYEENKKWFNLCQQWFIMMFIVIGISIFIGLVCWIFPYTSNIWYIGRYIAQLMNTAQNIGIFIIFVCKKRIKKLLLTRFGYQNYNGPPRTRQTEVVTD